MYHPAAALRNPQMQESFVKDFEKIPKIVEWVKTKGQSKREEGADQLEIEKNIKNALL
jgi:hypothetical protein